MSDFDVEERFSLLKKQGRSKKCKRCGLSILIKQFDQCPHCSQLNDNQLESLLERIENESRGHSALGKMFMIGALILIVLIVLMNA